MKRMLFFTTFGAMALCMLWAFQNSGSPFDQKSEIQAAKSWLDGYLVNHQMYLKGVVLDWKDVDCVKLKNGRVIVDVGISNSDDYIFAYAGKGITEAQKGKLKDVATGYTRLVITKMPNGSYFSAFLHATVDEDALKKDGKKYLKNHRASKIDKKFTGKLWYTKMTGGFMHGLRIEKGTATHSMMPQINPVDGSASERFCVIECEYGWTVYTGSWITINYECVYTCFIQETGSCLTCRHVTSNTDDGGWNVNDPEPITPDDGDDGYYPTGYEDHQLHNCSVTGLEIINPNQVKVEAYVSQAAQTFVCLVDVIGKLKNCSSGDVEIRGTLSQGQGTLKLFSHTVIKRNHDKRYKSWDITTKNSASVNFNATVGVTFDQTETNSNETFFIFHYN